MVGKTSLQRVTRHRISLGERLGSVSFVGLSLCEDRSWLTGQWPLVTNPVLLQVDLPLSGVVPIVRAAPNGNNP